MTEGNDWVKRPPTLDQAQVDWESNKYSIVTKYNVSSPEYNYLYYLLDP